MKRRIIIAGGGIGGLTAAIALRKCNADVLVLERQLAFMPAGAGITIQANAHAILSALGVNFSTEDASLIGAFRMVNESHRVLMRGDTRNMKIATPSINIHRADLHKALDATASQLGVERRLGCEVVSVVERARKVEVELQDGRKDSSDLLVGADGVRSCTRRALLGDAACSCRSSGQVCWRFAVESPDQNFTETVEHWSPGRRAGIVPLTRDRLYVYLVMSDWWKPDVVRQDTPEFLQREFGIISTNLDRVLKGLDSTTTIHSDELVEQPMISFGRGRTLLIGDAAHAMTPNLGQGAGMAIEDAASLALLYEESNNSIDSLAEQLTLRRTERVQKIQRKSWRIGQVAHTRSRILRVIRDFVLQRMPTASTEKLAKALWSPGMHLGELLLERFDGYPESTSASY